MIAITSIAPGHKNFENQFKAVESWKRAGYNVVSLNSPEEIEQLKEFKGVEFVPTIRHNKAIFGKPYVLVSAIIDYLKESGSEYSLIINSDIIIRDFHGHAEKLQGMSESGVVIMNRVDFEEDMSRGKVYEQGFDAFFINKKHLHIFPQSILCLGQCHWDFWLPYSAVMAGVKIMKLNEQYIFHKKHGVQYSKQDWIRTGAIFQGEAGLTKYNRVDKSTAHAYTVIKRALR